MKISLQTQRFLYALISRADYQPARVALLNPQASAIAIAAVLATSLVLHTRNELSVDVEQAERFFNRNHSLPPSSVATEYFFHVCIER
jgi:hypothetical protein